MEITLQRIEVLLIPLLLLSLSVPFAEGWLKSALIYHADGRDLETWKRNFMRVGEDGSYTGQWLFDHAILTAGDINGVDLMNGGLSGDDFLALLKALTNDAKDIDKAIQSLTQTFPLKEKISLSIGMPYIDDQNRKVFLEGKEYQLAQPEDRRKLASWYVNKVRDLRDTGGFQKVKVEGIYYHKEDITDANENKEIVMYLNDQIHSVGMKAVWVPYYAAPNNWNGKNFGFDVVVVQPGYSFASSIDRGSAMGDRLYAIGRKSAARDQCFEYEIRGGGRDPLENWIAHQYLAIAQETGASKFPQVFFVGTWLDRVKGKDPNLLGEWGAYSDLANYLGGQTISNFEIRIAFGMGDYDQSTGTLRKIFTISSAFTPVTSIRIDFRDTYGYWRGRLTVTIRNTGKTAYAQRMGSDILDPSYSAVMVPLANMNISTGTEVIVELSKEAGSVWPDIQQLVLARFEPPYVPNPLFEEASFSTALVNEGPYSDSVQSYKGFAQGKLTDGAKASGDWWTFANDLVGWSLIPEGIFSIVIDLAEVKQGIKEVRIWTHYDVLASVRPSTKLTALLASACPPHAIGTLDLGCVPEASSEAVKETKVDGETDRYLLVLDLRGNRGRFVTVTGVPLSWTLLDEVEVVDNSGSILSYRKPYRLTPVPGNLKSSKPYPDSGRELVDGTIFKNFVGGMTGLIGISSEDKQGSVGVTWDSLKLVQCARIWLTEADYRFGIILPSEVTIQVRDTFHKWGNGVKVTPSKNCGPSPCAALCFPKSLITGVTASFYNLNGWVMITEVTVE